MHSEFPPRIWEASTHLYVHLTPGAKEIMDQEERTLPLQPLPAPAPPTPQKPQAPPSLARTPRATKA